MTISNSAQSLATFVPEVIYTKCSIFYAIINYQFKRSELKNVEKLVKQSVQALEPYKNRLDMCAFLYNL